MRSDGPPCATCTTETCALPCPEMEPPTGLGTRVAARLKAMRVEAWVAHFVWKKTFEADPYSHDVEDQWHSLERLRARHEGAREIAKIILKGE